MELLRARQITSRKQDRRKSGDEKGASSSASASASTSAGAGLRSLTSLNESKRRQKKKRKDILDRKRTEIKNQATNLHSEKEKEKNTTPPPA